MSQIKINITPTLLTKLNILSSEYNTEVGGYLTGEIRDNEIFLKDLLIPSQQISSTKVIISPIDQLELRRKYGDKVKQIIGHWHSHHHLGCFWSGTDENNMQNIMEYKDFFVFVVSSNGDHLIRVSQTRPFKYNFDDCQFYIKNLTLDLMRKQVNNIIVNNGQIVRGYEGDNSELEENKNLWDPEAKSEDDEEDNGGGVEDIEEDSFGSSNYY